MCQSLTLNRSVFSGKTHYVISLLNLKRKHGMIYLIEPGVSNCGTSVTSSNSGIKFFPWALEESSSNRSSEHTVNLSESTEYLFCIIFNPF